MTISTHPLTKMVNPLQDLTPNTDSHGQFHELLGLCKGMIADGQLVEPEIEFLTKWFGANQDAVKAFPAREIYARIRRIHSDGVVTDEERQDLHELLARVTGHMETATPQAEEKRTPIANPSTRLPFDDPEPRVTFPGLTFSFTGKFVSGTRHWCIDQVLARGATFDEKPRSSTDFLVIGGLSSRDWAHTSFGRKIEAAMEFKPRLKIVSEAHWASYLV